MTEVTFSIKYPIARVTYGAGFGSSGLRRVYLWTAVLTVWIGWIVLVSARLT